MKKIALFVFLLKKLTPERNSLKMVQEEQIHDDATNSENLLQQYVRWA